MASKAVPTSSNKKPRILFLAADCNPQWHSLPALIAEYYLSLCKYADITLVTQVRNQKDLTAFLPEGSKVIYLDTEVIEKPIHKLSEFLTRDPNKAMTSKVAFRYPSYLYFEYCVWRQLKKQLDAGEFDIIHRASPMSPTLPSLIQFFSKVPFMIGPILGGLKWPDVFKGEMRREGEWLNYFRKLHRFLPFYPSTYKKASAILAGYQHTVNDLPDSCHHRVVEFSEGGIYPKDYPKRKFKQKEQLTILFVGRMVPFKQPEILIQCFANSPILQQHRLVMIGDGPELSRLKKICQEKNIADIVTFTGSIRSKEVRDWMYKADIFGFPSIREQGGGVLTMASMSSMPSVVVNYGGPAKRVPYGCGIRVDLNDVEKLTTDFQQALESLVSEPDKVESMGKAARKFTNRFYDWNWKGEKTREVYDWVLGKRLHKPNFWDPIDPPISDYASEEKNN